MAELEFEIIQKTSPGIRKKEFKCEREMDESCYKADGDRNAGTKTPHADDEPTPDMAAADAGMPTNDISTKRRTK